MSLSTPARFPLDATDGAAKDGAAKDGAAKDDFILTNSIQRAQKDKKKQAQKEGRKAKALDKEAKTAGQKKSAKAKAKPQLTTPNSKGQPAAGTPPKTSDPDLAPSNAAASKGAKRKSEQLVPKDQQDKLRE